MRLKNKVLISTSLVWAAFLLVIYLESRFYPSDSPVIFILTGVSFFVLLQLVLYVFIMKKYNITAKRERLLVNQNQNLQQNNLVLEKEIDNRKSAEKKLLQRKEHFARLARHDTLTKLPNRVFFNELLNKTLNHAARLNQIIAILFIDVDQFKAVNDALGHSAGDEALKIIANRLGSVLRASDTLARFGGDEFIVLLNDLQKTKFAGAVAEKLLEICSKPLQLKEYTFYLTASIGIAIFPIDGTSLETLQKNADLSMYKSKQNGGNNYQYFTQEMDVEAHEHTKAVEDLRQALAQNQFILHFQPITDLRTGDITAVEALIRWQHPENGLIDPMKFIPLAEDTGLIMEIGAWALHEACKINKSWHDQGHTGMTVTVNLSRKQILHQDIEQLIKDVLTETQLEPQYLELEINEAIITGNVESSIAKIAELGKLGLKISIDEFGSGFTSIRSLQQLPINFLKIDQGFIKGIPENTNHIAITTGIINLAHSLGIQVVGVGVENAEQLQFLVERNCDWVQGYYLSRPLPAAKVELLFNKIKHFESEKF